MKLMLLWKNYIEACVPFFNFSSMFEFSGKAPRAGLATLAGHIQPAGHTLETPGLGNL